MKMSLSYERKTVELSCNFIDYYMTTCPPVYSLIYIFSMKKLLHGENITVADIAQQFNITEGDVLNAWKHWESVGVVQLSNPDKNIAITFLPVHVPEKPEPDKAPPPKAIIGSRPQYTVEELTIFKKDSQEIARLFDKAQLTFGRMLNYNDMNVIFSFHDWLRLPLDVIEYLFAYCAENGHSNLRYIEKCALDWADNEIDELEKALDYVHNFDKNYREILRYMGQSTGYPTPSHRKYMDKWLDQWHMPLDLIMEACDRCVAAIDKPKFSYVDKVLADWHKQDVKDIAGVKAADAEFAKGRTKAFVPADKKASKPKTNRFVNFDQRETDYTQFEKLERAYLQQKLK